MTDLLKDPGKLTNKQLAEYPGVLRLGIRKAKVRKCHVSYS